MGLAEKQGRGGLLGRSKASPLTKFALPIAIVPAAACVRHHLTLRQQLFRSGSVTTFSRLGNLSTLFGIAIA